MLPELPDVQLYCHALNRLIVGETINSIQVRSPFVIRSLEPEIFDFVGDQVTSVEHFGKRIVWEMKSGCFFVFHLMIAGRFHWRKPNTRPKSKSDLIAFGYQDGTLMLTEASSKHRASLHIETTREAAERHRPPGLDLFSCSLEEFRRQLQTENRTVKRALTNPSWFSGIGNAYSDEILWDARISPVKWTSRLSESEVENLFEACKRVLSDWSERLISQHQDKFPERVTAFRPEMAVHGKFGKACPRCQKPVQRIVYAENEMNYCAECQNNGQVLADRSLSRLLKKDWPRDINDWETDEGR